MSKRSLIDSIAVKSPCSEDWEQMSGSEKVRFCGHCAFEVNNLSELTRKQALRLVSRSNGRICVRYVKDPSTNAPVFADRLYKITRRAGVAAAGVLGATLAVSSLAYAQQGSGPVSWTQKAEISQADNADKNKSESGTATVSGTITDRNGMVVPSVAVTLISVETGFSRSMTSDSEGFYQFEKIRDGKYKVEAAASGFEAAVREIEVSVNETKVADFELAAAVPVEMVTVGDIAMIEYATPLFAAVSAGDAERVSLLLARGENVNARDENYNRITPLFLAIENGSAEIAETLLNFGAKINIRDDQRQTPLMRLDEDATPALVDLLIKHGARVNLADKQGNTPLILAARGVRAEVLQILIRHGARVDDRNGAGRTALMEAADADNLENVRALLLAGADASLADNDGETPLDLTTDAEIETLLVEFGAQMPVDAQ